MTWCLAIFVAVLLVALVIVVALTSASPATLGVSIVASVTTSLVIVKWRC